MSCSDVGCWVFAACKLRRERYQRAPLLPPTCRGRDDIRKKTCAHQGCSKGPSFGVAGGMTREFCVETRLIDLNKIKCGITLGLHQASDVWCRRGQEEGGLYWTLQNSQGGAEDEIRRRFSRKIWVGENQKICSLSTSRLLETSTCISGQNRLHD